MERTVYIVVEGGVAHMQYDGPLVLRPGDTVTIEVRDFDVDQYEGDPSGYDAYGNPYINMDSTTFKVQE